MPRGIKISVDLKQRIIDAYSKGGRQSGIARRDGLKLKSLQYGQLLNDTKEQDLLKANPSQVVQEKKKKWATSQCDC